MTVEEIFKQLSHRMLSGIMLHSDMVNYYRFLSLDGYAKCHEYRMIEESKGYRKLHKHYLEQYDKLLPEGEVSKGSEIPSEWYSHVRQDVDEGTIKSSVKDGLNKWIKHEEETKKVYEDMAIELRQLGHIKSAIYVEDLVCKVAKELKHAKKYQLNKQIIGYDAQTIEEEQREKFEHYESKISLVYCRD